MREYQLFVSTDGSITIIDPVTKHECFADGETIAADQVVEMLDEAGMI